jgi:two-component system CheB/CheR fusion protein
VVVTGLGLHALLRGAFGRQRKAETSLREANELKTRFFAMLSHEFRNPLAPMRQALWLLEREPNGSPRATAARETLARQVLHLSRVTDDLVDVAQSARGQIELHRSEQDLAHLVRDAVQDYEHLFTARGIALDVDVGSLPTWVDVDPARLGQAIGNLLSNASKFTSPGGHVRISVERASGGMAQLRIADDGLGIAPDLLPHVFEPFVQGETTLDRPRGGLGLGLSLVRSIVELQGGTVRARSAGPGRGAEITVELRLAAERPVLATTATRAPEAMPHHRVLVIEDHPDAAETLREMLLLWDQEVEVAHDGRDGIEKARAWHPDVVLCDIGLPIVDGYAVARAIRSSPDGRSTYLVAVTGYTSSDDLRQAASAGFDRHLAKPVPVETLADLLSSAETSATTRH